MACLLHEARHDRTVRRTVRATVASRPPRTVVHSAATAMLTESRGRSACPAVPGRPLLNDEPLCNAVQMHCPPRVTMVHDLEICRTLAAHANGKRTGTHTLRPPCQESTAILAQSQCQTRMASFDRPAVACSERRPELLDARTPVALVVVAVGPDECLERCRGTLGMGDRHGRHGDGELSDRASCTAAPVRSGS